MRSKTFKVESDLLLYLYNKSIKYGDWDSIIFKLEDYIKLKDFLEKHQNNY